MGKFPDYQNKYSRAVLDRRDGILEIRLHTDGGPLVWDEPAHTELADLFNDVALDRDNRVVILTGTGDSFCATIKPNSFLFLSHPQGLDRIVNEGRRMFNALLAIEAPVIAAINGPVRVHPEIPMLSDIVIAADTTVIQDSPHFISGVVPGDGCNIVWTELLGMNRGRYFLLTGEEIDAAEAQRLGVVGEVVPLEEVLPRAWELAQRIAANSDLTLRYSRIILTEKWRKRFTEELGFGMMLAGSAINDLMNASGSPFKDS